MLKSDLIRPRIHTAGNTVSPRLLPADYHWLAVAAELSTLCQQQLGQTRGTWIDALRAYEGDSLDYPILRGLAAVLENQANWGRTAAVDPVTLRAALFAGGPAVTAQSDPNAHAAASSLASREGLIRDLADHYDITPTQLEASLFADLAEEQHLQQVSSLTPVELIARYNMEVARGLLYWAKEMTIEVADGYKDLFRLIKLFKLMHTIQPAGDGYLITLHGPLSPFVNSTIRYGLQFAKFLPALLLCHTWQMTAAVRPPGHGRFLTYTLDDTTTLTSHFTPSPEYDSRLEADFAAEFEVKYGRVDRRWRLSREDVLIPTGNTVMIPDFTFTHRRDGRRAYLEIVGFWHRDYLRRKLAKVQAAERTDLILLVYESANVDAEAFVEAHAGTCLFFKRKPVLKDVLAAVEKCARLPAA